MTTPSLTRQAFVVASYNVHRCIGRDGVCDPARIAAVIAEVEADVIGLQEVLSPDGHDHLDRIAPALTCVFGPAMRIADGDYGNALLTRHRVLSVRHHDLSVGRREPRGATEVTLDVGGRRVRAVVTHLGLWPGERRKQVRRLLTQLAREPEPDLEVLLGDINEWLLIGRPLRWLHRRFGEPPAPVTFPAGLPLFGLDRIWVHPCTALMEATAHRTALSRWASDHLPIRATVTLPPNRVAEGPA